MSALGGDEWSSSRPGRFTAGKEPRYTLNCRLGGPQRRSGRFWEERKTVVDIGELKDRELPENARFYFLRDFRPLEGCSNLQGC